MPMRRSVHDTFYPWCDPGHEIFTTLTQSDWYACELTRLAMMASSGCDSIGSGEVADELAHHGQVELRAKDPIEYFNGLSSPLRAAVALSIEIRASWFDVGIIQSRIFLQRSVPWVKALYEYVLDGETLDPASVELRKWALESARKHSNQFQPISNHTFTQIYGFDAYRQLHQPLIRRIDENNHPVQLAVPSVNQTGFIVDQNAVFANKSHFEHGYTEKLWLYHKLDRPLLEQFSSGHPEQICAYKHHWEQNTEVATQSKMRTLNRIAARHLRVSFTRLPQMQSADRIAREYAAYRMGVCSESREQWLRSVRLTPLQSRRNQPLVNPGR